MFLGRIMEYECTTKKEYIEMQIHDYLEHLAEAYQKNFQKIKKALTIILTQSGKEKRLTIRQMKH